MHAVVLYHSPWEPTRLLAAEVATSLGCRAIAFDRRPDLTMYDLVVIGTSALGFLDPQLGLYLAGGELRGKGVALFADALGPGTGPWLQVLSSATRVLGGAQVHPETLATGVGLFGVDEGDRERARAWGQRLLEAYPAPAFPRGEPGRRATQL